MIKLYRALKEALNQFLASMTANKDEEIVLKKYILIILLTSCILVFLFCIINFNLSLEGGLRSLLNFCLIGLLAVLPYLFVFLTHHFHQIKKGRRLKKE